MSWSAAMDNLAKAVTSMTAFGEPVTLPDGRQITAVVTYDNAAAFDWGDGVSQRLDRRDQATLQILDEDAPLLTLGDIISVRERSYRVGETPDPLHNGHHAVGLIPIAGDPS